MKPNNCIFDCSPLDEETVQSYQSRIQAGEQLPAIVIWGDGQKRSILDGRHRVEALLRCGMEGMSCYYEVSCSYEKGVFLRRKLNSERSEPSVPDILSSALVDGSVGDQVIANPPYHRRKPNTHRW